MWWLVGGDIMRLWISCENSYYLWYTDGQMSMFLYKGGSVANFLNISVKFTSHVALIAIVCTRND